MKLSIHPNNDILFIDKPNGFTTHSSEADLPGIKELIEEAIPQKLWVIHRLDLTTSGALAFATDEKSAQLYSEEFAQREVKKVYFFVTDKWTDLNETKVENHLHHEKHKTQIVKDLPSNSATQFTRVKSTPFFSLWQAEPLSGKPHQIRVHAASLGIPILGDTLYGGSNFPVLCLHSERVQFKSGQHFVSTLPRYFERLGFLKDPELVKILSGLDRRQRLFRFLQNPQDCIRLCHLESDRFRVDQFGSQIWIYDFSDFELNSQDKDRFCYLSQTLGKPLLVRKMKNRGEAKANLNDSPDFIVGDWKSTWQALENEVHYEFRDFQGLSPGLFLDQRENRAWIKKNSPNKKVLNLFAFTGGFSLNAALGFAHLVTTVDLSQNFIDWTKKNFELNSVDVSKHEFFKRDSRDFLELAVKKERKWDLIIIDPPSFSRSDRGVFKIEKDLKELLTLASKILEKNGKILVSTNYEKWTQIEFDSVVQKSLPRSKKIKFDWQGLDFETPHETHRGVQLLKSGVWEP